MFGLRLGPDPRVVVTTTPKPIKIIRELIADPTTAITRGSTYDNRANLAPAFLHPNQWPIPGSSSCTASRRGSWRQPTLSPHRSRCIRPGRSNGKSNSRNRGAASTCLLPVPAALRPHLPACMALASYASRSAVLAGGAAVLAARALNEKLVRAASHLIEASVADIQAADGRVFVVGTDRSLTLPGLHRVLGRRPFSDDVVADRQKFEIGNRPRHAKGKLDILVNNAGLCLVGARGRRIDRCAALGTERVRPLIPAFSGLDVDLQCSAPENEGAGQAWHRGAKGGAGV